MLIHLSIDPSLVSKFCRILQKTKSIEKQFCNNGTRMCTNGIPTCMSLSLSMPEMRFILKID